MTREELFSNAEDAIRSALEDSIVIMNSDGNVLSKRFGSDELEFSPKLNCSKDVSTVIFDDEDGAKRTIDDVLSPQDGDDSYFAIRITKCKTEDGDAVINVETDGNIDGNDADDILKEVLDKVEAESDKSEKSTEGNKDKEDKTDEEG